MMTGGACRDVSYFGNSPLYSSTLQNYRGTSNNTIFKKDPSNKVEETTPFQELRKAVVKGVKNTLTEALTYKYDMPDDYDKNFSFLKESTILEKINFLVFERFTDLGVGTSPQIDRLFFKNEDFSQFCSSEYLIQRKYATPQTYLSFITKTNCAAEEAKTPSHFRLNSPLSPGTLVEIKTSEGKIMGKIKKYNDEVDNAKKQDDAYDAWDTEETTRKANIPKRSWSEYMSGKSVEPSTVTIRPPATNPPSAPTCKKAIKKLGKEPKCESFYTVEYKTTQGSWSEMKNVEQSHMKVFYEPSFFAFNDEYNVPFVNPYFFNFLHMFKYTLSKAFSKFRLWRIYRIIDGIVDIMTNTPYVDVSDKDIVETKQKYKDEINDKLNIRTLNIITPTIQDNLDDYVIWRNTYMYALRRKCTNYMYLQLGKLNNTLNPYQKGSTLTSSPERGDNEDDLRAKNPCANFKRYKNYLGMISSLSMLSSEEAESKSEQVDTFQPHVRGKTENDAENIGNEDEDQDEKKKEEEEQHAPPPALMQPPPTRRRGSQLAGGGGIRSRRKKYNRITQKKNIHGGGLFLSEKENLYYTRAFRILTMHLNTTNLMEAADPNSPKIPRFPAYLVLEQIRYITMAMMYFDNTDREGKLKEITDQDYSTLDASVKSYLNSNTEISKIYADLKEGKRFTPDFNFIADSTVHKVVLDYLKELNKKLRSFSFLKVDISKAAFTNDYGFLKKIFTHASNTMFYEYSQRLFQDPRALYPGTNLKQKLEEHYRIKGYYSNFKDVLNGRPHVADTLEFMKSFTFCLIMMPHFACSQFIGLIISFILDHFVKFTTMVTLSLMNTIQSSPFTGVKVLLSPLTMLGVGVTGSSILVTALISLINMPNCYIALALMFFTLVRSLNPFMPYAADRHRLRLKSDRLNSAYYNPKSNPTQLSLKKTPMKTLKSGKSSSGGISGSGSSSGALESIGSGLNAAGSLVGAVGKAMMGMS